MKHGGVTRAHNAVDIIEIDLIFVHQLSNNSIHIIYNCVMKPLQTPALCSIDDSRNHIIAENYLAVVGAGSPFGRLVQRAVKDPAQRRQLLAEPRRVLIEAGVELPEGVEIEVLENTDTVIHLVLPPLVETEGGGGR